MKKIFTLNLILVSFCAFSQPVITALYNPIYNDIYVYKIVDDTSTAIAGQAGAGVIWNLASMHGLLTTRQYNWIPTSTTNDAAIFGANSNIAAEVVQTGVSAWYEYYQVGPNYTGDFKTVGSHVGPAITNFFGGYLTLDYPFSYGQSCTDTMIGSTGVAYINGRSTTTYDGYGTLQLEAQSGGNFSNVARIKVEENYIANYGILEYHHAVAYYWYDHTTINMTKQPIAVIMTHEWVDLNGTPQREKIALMRQVLFLNGVAQLNLAANISVQPNPFQNKIIFSLPAVDSPITVEVCDITGRMIKTVQLEKSVAARDEELEMGDLPGGIYLAKISCGNETVVKKIVKN